METLQTGILFSSGAERVTWFSTRPTFTIFGFSEASTQILAIQYQATLWGWMGLFSGNVSHSCSLPMKSGCDWIFFYAAENFRRVMTIRAMRTEAPRRAARTMAATAPGPREPSLFSRGSSNVESDSEASGGTPVTSEKGTDGVVSMGSAPEGSSGGSCHTVGAAAWGKPTVRKAGSKIPVKSSSSASCGVLVQGMSVSGWEDVDWEVRR